MSQGQHLPVSQRNPSQRSIHPHIHYTPAPPSSRSQVIHHGSYINIDGIPAMRDDNSVWRMLGEPTKDSIEKRKSRLVIAAFRMPPIEEENEHGGASKTIPKRRSGKVSNSIPDAACWSKIHEYVLSTPNVLAFGLTVRPSFSQSKAKYHAFTSVGVMEWNQVRVIVEHFEKMTEGVKEGIGRLLGANRDKWERVVEEYPPTDDTPDRAATEDEDEDNHESDDNSDASSESELESNSSTDQSSSGSTIDHTELSWDSIIHDPIIPNQIIGSESGSPAPAGTPRTLDKTTSQSFLAQTFARLSTELNTKSRPLPDKALEKIAKDCCEQLEAFCVAFRMCKRRRLGRMDLDRDIDEVVMEYLNYSRRLNFIGIVFLFDTATHDLHIVPTHHFQPDMFSESLSALGKHVVEALHPHTQVIPVVIETLSKKGERLFPGLVEIGDEIFSSKVTWKKLKRAGKQGSGSRASVHGW